MTQTREPLIKTSQRHPVPRDEVTFLPSQRWVRGTVGDTTVFDTRNPVLVWAPGHTVALYAIPRSDIRPGLLVAAEGGPARRKRGVQQFYDLVVDGERRPLAAWSYGPGDLEDVLVFDWFLRSEPGIDHWYEEEEEIYLHPRDPFKRIDALRSTRHVTVSINGIQVADTTRPVTLFETRMPTRYYIPAEDVDFTWLTESPVQTRCPYKGIANYWSFSGEPAAPEIVWYYKDPIPAAAPIKDLLCFYNEFVDITVDGTAEGRPVTEFSRLR